LTHDVDAASGFDQMYRATNRSVVYAEAVRASARDLPGWLVERSDRLLAEMGEPAESLLEEARNGLAREALGTSRVRHVLLVAERRASASLA
jgi:hypothetical protein